MVYLQRNLLSCWFSEDLFLAGDFVAKSRMILNYFMDYVVATILVEKKMKVIYFHNLSRFDGIPLIKHIIANRPEWKLTPLMRNGEISQFEVKIEKLKLVFRESMKLLPGSLRSLGESLCPELGCKANVDHSSVTLAVLSYRRL